MRRGERSSPWMSLAGAYSATTQRSGRRESGGFRGSLAPAPCAAAVAVVRAYDFDLGAGAVTNPRVLIRFGLGEGLRTLFVTSMRRGMVEDKLARNPRAGGIIALDAGVAGLPETRFAG